MYECLKISLEIVLALHYVKTHLMSQWKFYVSMSDVKLKMKRRKTSSKSISIDEKLEAVMNQSEDFAIPRHEIFAASCARLQRHIREESSLGVD